MIDSTSPFPTAPVGSVPFQVSSLPAAADWLITSALETGTGVNVRLANAYNVALADHDAEYRELFRTGVNFPDGKPVVWYMNHILIGGGPAEQVRGPSLMLETIARGQQRNVRHFLLGSTPETLSRLHEAILKRFPGALVTGAFSPPFAPVDEDFVARCADAVDATGADIVWIGLGTPKQDYLGTALARRQPRVFVNVGAAFDFAAGTVREAPRWLQGSGFEWLFRLVSEPRRLWRRYLFGNTRFLRVIARQQRARTRGLRHS